MSTAENEKLAVALDDALTDPASLRAISYYMSQPEVRALYDNIERRRRLEAIEATAEALAGATGAVTPTEVPMWVRLGMLSVTTAWVAGDARTCMHDPRADGAVPGWAVAWKPNLVACPQCLHLLEAGGGVEEYRCDCCGRVSLPEHGGVAVATVGNGSLLYRAAACPDCWTEFKAAARSVGA